MVRNVKAYILITARRGAADKLAETIRKVKNVKSSECVYGRFDVIAIVESSEMKNLSRIVNQIQKYPQIIHTETAFSHCAEDSESEISE
jgi:DNA-binding Lrp family transcriptional regulator